MLTKDDLAEQLADLSTAAKELAAYVNERDDLPKRDLSSRFAEACNLNDKLERLGGKLKPKKKKK